MVPSGPIHRRSDARDSASAVRALLVQNDARPRPCGCGRAVPQPVHAGDGATGWANDVEVEGQHRGPGRDGGEIRRGHVPAVHAVRGTAGEKHRLERVERGGTVPLHQPLFPLGDA